jgi:hypothetical protein
MAAEPVAKLFERLKQSVRRKSKDAARSDPKGRRRDSNSGNLLGKEIERASPERAGEVAGHPVERVET